MNCPSCKKPSTFFLLDSTDDYHDAEVCCNRCQASIGQLQLWDEFKVGRQDEAEQEAINEGYSS